MLPNILRNGFSVETVISLLTSLFVIFCVMPIHECAHAFVASKLGDQTARLSGRLTLNPLAHIDPIGALMLLFVGVGYAKAVPVNIRNFKNRKMGMALTSLAGPFSNLIMAFIGVIFLNIAIKQNLLNTSTILNTTEMFLDYFVYINIYLAVFNLIPIPPLDGSRLASAVLPDKYYYKLMQYERYIMIGLFILIFTGVLNKPLEFLADSIYNGMNWVVGLVI
jgi:Zn-dependent protease